jgi:hypothetical protein
MKYIPRQIESELLLASKHFSGLILTGPRRAGKTTLLRKLFPKAQYYLLEDPDIIARLRTDPHSFIEEIRPPVILDETQNVPEILSYVRTQIDRFPNKKGQWLLTGSQESPLILLEAKASRTVWPETAESLSRLSKVVSNYKVDRFLIYRPSKGKESISALRPGIKALSIEKLLSALS